MRKSKFTETQIFQILKENERGVPVPDICRKHNIARQTFYAWRAKFNGLDASKVKRLRELELENNRLKRMFATLSMDHEILREALEKKF
tara:strand:+ start:75 stop:341 length:267 start_codon:yes stop_codon:yes gene_type:complete